MKNVVFWKEVSNSNEIYIASLDQDELIKTGSEKYVINRLSKQEALDLCKEISFFLNKSR